MKKQKVLLSIILVLSIIAVSILPTLAESVTALDEGAPGTAESKISDSLKEKMENADVDEKIQVVVWYDDVDQSSISAQAEKETASTINKKYPDISRSDIGAILRNEESLSKGDESSSKITNDICNIYIDCRREIAVRQYIKVSKSILAKGEIKDSEIIFNSRYAPMLIVKLTADKIIRISYLSNVVSVEEYIERPSEVESVETNLENVNIPDIAMDSELGLTGDGVKVGIIDAEIHGLVGNIDIDNGDYITRYRNGVEIHDYSTLVVLGPSNNNPLANHACGVANILFTIAPDITLYCCQWNNAQIEAMLDEGVNLINMSMGLRVSELDQDYAYTTDEKWFDHVITTHNVMLIKSAGDTGKSTDIYGPRVTSPGLAKNAITVGCFAEEGTYSVPDHLDTLFALSSYKNSANNKHGAEKPDVVMPTTGATSFAAPVLTGTLALLLQLESRLKTRLLALKAITLASCYRKVKQYTTCNNSSYITGTQENITDGITDRQGAGVPDALRMANMINQGTYGIGTISGTNHTINIVQPHYNAANMNVSITWFIENTVNNDHTGISDAGAEHNLDLSVYRNNTLLKQSSLLYSSTEMCYFPISNSDFKYKLEITHDDTTQGDVQFGYAWSTDSPVITPEFQYGAYYLRNADTNKYLTYNSAGATGILKLELNSITNQNVFSHNHTWVMNNHNYTTIKAASDNGDVQLGISSTYCDTNARYARTTESEKIYYPLTHPDGTYSILYPIGINVYALSYYNDSAVWKCINGTAEITQSEKWYFDKSNYVIMDANADGSIDTTDVTFIQRSLVGLETPTNIQKYLGDVNRNGEMDILDAYELLVYLS